mgnify:CR=1 FL=1
MFFKKRLMNCLVTVPTMLVLATILIVFGTYITNQMDILEKVTWTMSTGEAIASDVLLLVGALLFCGVFLGALLAIFYAFLSIVFGVGLVYRRVDSGDSLQETSGESIFVFTRMDFIPRRDPIFHRGCKLMTPTFL